MTADKLRSFDAWSRSVRNFESWIGDAVPGGSDIDFICERRGHFLIVEGKPFYKGVTVPWGQHLMLKALAELEPFTVLLVGEQDDKLYISGYSAHAKPEYRRSSGAFWPASSFTPTTKDGLRERVRAWWSEASTSEQEAA